MNGLKVTPVPYKGSAPALIDVSSGQISYALETVAPTLPQIKAGRLKAYGITIARVSALAPDLQPLAKIANMPGYDVAAWIGIMVAAGTPKTVVDRLSAAVHKAMQSPDVRERIATAGLEVDYRRTDEFTRDLKEQKARFADIIRKGNIKIE